MVVSLAKIPYYYFVIVFMAFVALLSVSNAASTTGFDADFYLGALLVSLVIVAASFYYLYAARQGVNDELDLQVGGISLGKKTYYVAVLVIAIWRLLAGYRLNHTAYGLGAIWGLLWIVAALVLSVFTYANYRVLRPKIAKV